MIEIIKEYWYLFCIAALLLCAGILAAVLLCKKKRKAAPADADTSAAGVPLYGAHTLLTDDTLDLVPQGQGSGFSIDREITYMQSDQVI